MRPLLRAGAVVLLAALMARAGPRMSSETSAVERSADGAAGGARAAGAANELDAFGEAAASAEVLEAPANRIMAGYAHIHAFPRAITDLAETGVSSVSSGTLVWTAPGYDGEAGALPAGTSYFIQVTSDASAAARLFAAGPALTVSTSGVASGQFVSAGATGLIANTTWFIRAWTRDAWGNLSPDGRVSTFTTLAHPPTPLASAFIEVGESTVAVAWAAFSPSPPDSSSKSAGGYLLEVSSTNFGQLTPGGVTASSLTYAVLLSTLVVAPAVFDATNYYRVASLNWEGRKNYLDLPSLNFSIEGSTGLVNLGDMDGTLVSTVSVSSMVVRNDGDLPVRLVLSAQMATLPSSPWTLGTARGLETALLEGLWNTGPPAPPAAAFATPITPDERVSGGGGGAYAGDLNGVSVPAGASRTLWFRLSLPTSTERIGEEVIRVTVRPIYP